MYRRTDVLTGSPWTSYLSWLLELMLLTGWSSYYLDWSLMLSIGSLYRVNAPDWMIQLLLGLITNVLYRVSKSWCSWLDYLVSSYLDWSLKRSLQGPVENSYRLMLENLFCSYCIFYNFEVLILVGFSHFSLVVRNAQILIIYSWNYKFSIFSEVFFHLSEVISCINFCAL